MIEMHHICKTFRVAQRNAGFGEAVRALFRKDYTLVHALQDVSFTIGDGEIVGYIGPNGAGKSSTIKVMSGILTPDSGQCVIDGLVPWKSRKEHVSRIGVVFGQRSQLWWDVPVIDSFELIRDIYRVEPEAYRRQLDELTELLDLGEILRTPARQLSLGQRMRCEIAGSLLHSPRLLFLDEPTIGLDAVSKRAVREFIRRINREKKTTVILTTHDMQDIEALAQRILLIGKGRILLDGTLEQLKKRHGGQKRLAVDYGEKGPRPDRHRTHGGGIGGFPVQGVSPMSGRVYGSFFRLRFINGLQYRAAAYAGVATQFAWGFMEILLFHAFYQTDPAAFPMEFSQLAAYVWLQQAFLALFMLWFFENEIFDGILSGTIAYELARPTDLYVMWFTRSAANRLSRAVLRCMPILVVAVFLPEPFRLAAPANAAAFGWFALTLVLGLLTVVAFSMLVYISAFYTLSSQGIRLVVSAVGDLLMGGLIPLPFMPEGVQKVLELTPFAAMQNLPLRAL